MIRLVGKMSNFEDIIREACSSRDIAGAVLVETYTGLAYAGPAFVPKAKQELADCLARDGFRTVQEAVGADHR